MTPLLDADGRVVNVVAGVVVTPAEVAARVAALNAARAAVSSFPAEPVLPSPPEPPASPAAIPYPAEPTLNVAADDATESEVAAVDTANATLIDGWRAQCAAVDAENAQAMDAVAAAHAAAVANWRDACAAAEADHAEQRVQLEDARAAAAQALSGVMACPDGLTVGQEGGAIGQRWDGSAYVSPDDDVVDHATLYAALAEMRWQREVGGVILDEMPLPTDRTRRAAIKDAADKVRNGTLPAPLNLSLGGGVYGSFSPAQLDAIVAAIAHHVQAAFDAEFQIASAIASGAITTLSQLKIAWNAT